VEEEHSRVVAVESARCGLRFEAQRVDRKSYTICVYKEFTFGTHLHQQASVVELEDYLSLGVVAVN
jgi:hypothetical protein